MHDCQLVQPIAICVIAYRVKPMVTFKDKIGITYK